MFLTTGTVITTLFLCSNVARLLPPCRITLSEPHEVADLSPARSLTPHISMSRWQMSLFPFPAHNYHGPWFTVYLYDYADDSQTLPSMQPASVNVTKLPTDPMDGQRQCKP